MQHSSDSEGALSPLHFPGPDGKSPLAVAYTDKHRSLAVLYPQPQPQPEPQPTPPQTPAPSMQLHPLMAAIAIFLVGIGVAIPIAVLGTVLDAIVVEAPPND